MPNLENWNIVLVTNERSFVTGEIHNDEKNRFKDGKLVQTSKILEFNKEENFIQTKNTRYELGKPSEYMDLDSIESFKVEEKEDV